jgi:2-enoate reductase
MNKLFQPGFIGKMKLKNRVFLAPMGHGTHDLDGGYSAQETAYYAARARGGVGMVMAGGIVTSRFDGHIGNLFESMDVFNRFEQFVDEMHSYDCKVCVQLSAGIGRVGGALPGFNGPVSASAVPAFFDPEQTCRALELDEIAFLIEAYGKAAAMVQAAGADSINIHGYGGYLIDQFMTSLWNQRTDKYGGDLDGRMRFPMELIAKVQQVCGADYPIIFKMTPDHFFEGGRTLDEGLEIARRLEEAGVQALQIDAGCYESWHITIPTVHQNTRRHQVELAEAVKLVVNIPVLTGGKLGNPGQAESVLSNGQADYIGLGRPLLADPDWVLKVKEKRQEDIIHCIYCNEGCIVRIFGGMRLGCAVNAATGKEAVNIIALPQEARSVLIIGAGAGGIEAAIQGVKVGHKVTIWEKSDQLGGTLLPAAAPSFKSDIKHYIEYLRGQVKKLAIPVKFNTEATVDKIVAENPDLVILAIGAAPIIPPLPGIDRDYVTTAVAVLKGEVDVGRRVLVAGGGLVGVETALELAIKGKQVTLVEMQPDILPEPLFLGDTMKIREMLAESTIEVLTNTRLERIEDDHVVLSQGGEESILAVDTLVVAVGYRSNGQMEDALRDKVRDVVVVGDAVAPRRVQHAVWEGFHAIRALSARTAV